MSRRSKIYKARAPRAGLVLCLKQCAGLQPAPQYFSSEESRQIIETQRTPGARLTPHLYNRILQWNAYAIPRGMSPSLGITQQRLESLKPLDHEQPPEPAPDLDHHQDLPPAQAA